MCGRKIQKSRISSRPTFTTTAEKASPSVVQSDVRRAAARQPACRPSDSLSVAVAPWPDPRALQVFVGGIGRALGIVGTLRDARGLQLCDARGQLQRNLMLEKRWRV